MPRLQYVFSTSPEFRAVKLKYEAAKKALLEVTEELQKIRSSCDHVAAHMVGKKDLTSEGAVCEKCQADLGWWCPINPKHYCEYNEEEDPCRDFCIHCDNPEERK